MFSLLPFLTSRLSSGLRPAVIPKSMGFCVKSIPVIRLWLTPIEVSTGDRKSTRLNSSHVRISYAVFCLKKKITHRSLLRFFGVVLMLLRRALQLVSSDPRLLTIGWGAGVAGDRLAARMQPRPWPGPPVH